MIYGTESTDDGNGFPKQWANGGFGLPEREPDGWGPHVIDRGKKEKQKWKKGV